MSDWVPYCLWPKDDSGSTTEITRRRAECQNAKAFEAMRARAEAAERLAQFASGDGWNELPKLREKVASLEAENKECMSRFLHEQRMAEVEAERDQLRESLGEALSYFPKVPTQPYEKEMAKQILKLEAERGDLSIKLQRTVSAAHHALLEMSAWMGIPEKKRSAKIDELMGNVKYCAEHDLRHIEESQEIAQLRRDNEGFREALREIDRHLQFFAHVEKRYKEVGKDKVAFDKCAEIRAAHEAAREAIAKFGGKK